MEIIENGLYSYPAGSGRCKHGMVITFKDVEGVLCARDTYWSTGGTIYKVEDIKSKITLLLDLNNAKEVTESEFFLYDEADRAYIPVGGWHEKYLVRTDAEKRIDYIIEDLEFRIKENNSQMLSLKYDNERLKEELKQYK